MDVAADQANLDRSLPDDRFSVVVVLAKGNILPADPDRLVFQEAIQSELVFPTQEFGLGGLQDLP